MTNLYPGQLERQVIEGIHVGRFSTFSQESLICTKVRELSFSPKTSSVINSKLSQFYKLEGLQAKYWSALGELLMSIGSKNLHKHKSSYFKATDFPCSIAWFAACGII